MDKVNDLEQQTRSAYDNVKAQLDVLNDMIQYNGFADYTVVANVSWDSVGISILHSKFNWTTFLTVTVSNKGFDFSHGSGGFKDSTVNDRLTATRRMFDIVSLIQADSDKIEAQRIVISKLDTILTNTRLSYEAEIEKTAIATATIDMLKGHTEVTSIDNLLEIIKDGGTIKVYSINYNTSERDTSVQMNEVENRGRGRANYYFQDYSYSKKDLISALSTRKFYTENI